MKFNMENTQDAKSQMDNGDINFTRRTSSQEKEGLTKSSTSNSQKGYADKTQSCSSSDKGSNGDIIPKSTEQQQITTDFQKSANGENSCIN
jgi:hypothetical protein